MGHSSSTPTGGQACKKHQSRRSLDRAVPQKDARWVPSGDLTAPDCPPAVICEGKDIWNFLPGQEASEAEEVGLGQA